MKKGSFFLIIGLLLIAAALCLTGYNIYDDFRAKAESEVALTELRPQIKPDPIPVQGRPTKPETPEQIEYPDYVMNPDKEMPEEIIEGRRYIGILNIPSLELELPVCSQWDYSNLQKAPCRYVGSVYKDDMIICAHNYDKHFGQIKNLKYGAEVTFTDVDGNVFKYEVLEVQTIGPYAIEEMTGGDWDMTMFTCTIGGATRVTVRCERIE